MLYTHNVYKLDLVNNTKCLENEYFDGRKQNQSFE